MGRDRDSDVELVETAMVTIRRRQNRRSLARLDQQRRVPDAAADPPIPGLAIDVLDVLEAAEQAGRPASVSSVAAALGVDQPRASRLVAATVEAGLARREADQADGRRAFLVPTAAGRAVTEQVRGFRRSIFAAAMADWPETDRHDFARLLTRFVEALPRPLP